MRILRVLLIILCLAAPTLAEIKVAIYPNPVPQGKCAAVQVINEDGYVKKVEAVFSTTTKEIMAVPFYAWGFKWRGIVPIALSTEPRDYVLKFKITDNNDQVSERQEVLTVTAGKFKTVNFKLPAEKSAILYSGKVDEEWPKIETFLTQENPEQLWTSKFKLPIKGWLTMPFGTHEFVSGKKRSQHTGNDFGSRLVYRALVKAANSGTVVIARPFQVFGNTVVIDHGQGIFSIYYHLSKFAVKEGQAVNTGQVLGNMGTTGISTSPHLHFGFSVHDVRVDGLQWINDPTFRKYAQ